MSDLLLGVYCPEVVKGRVDVVGEEGPGIVSLWPMQDVSCSS